MCESDGGRERGREGENEKGVCVCVCLCVCVCVWDLIVDVVDGNIVTGHGLFLGDQAMKKCPCMHFARVTCTFTVNWLKICTKLSSL